MYVCFCSRKTDCLSSGIDTFSIKYPQFGIIGKSCKFFSSLDKTKNCQIWIRVDVPIELRFLPIEWYYWLSSRISVKFSLLFIIVLRNITPKFTKVHRDFRLVFVFYRHNFDNNAFVTKSVTVHIWRIFHLKWLITAHNFSSFKQ